MATELMLTAAEANARGLETALNAQGELLAETEKKRQDAEKLSALLTATRDAFVKAAVDEAVKSQAEASAGKAQAREASLRAEAAEALREQV